MTPVRYPLLLLVLAAACVSRDQAVPDSSRGVAPPPPAPTPVPAESTTRPSTPSLWVVTPRGFGPVLAGIPIATLGSLLGEPVRAKYEAGSRCGYLNPATLPKDVLVMVESDTVARVDVRAKGVLTAEGAGVGDTEASVLARYAGRVRTMPHKYTSPQGHYLIVSALPDTAHLIIFETDGRAVLNYRAGRRPAVEFVEGCF